MKIKNILALGLIAVVSGISTAQTYNATAGTNGTTDIQSDYSVATGDGASVSVDVPLEFELPKKVAIAVATTTNDITANPMFSNFQQYYGLPLKHTELLLSGEANADQTIYVGQSKEWLWVQGSVYSNADNTSVTATFDGIFTHESDPNSQIESACQNNSNDFCFRLYNNRDENVVAQNVDATITKTVNIADSFENQRNFALFTLIKLDSIDPTDRAGKYAGLATLTATVL